MHLKQIRIQNLLSYEDATFHFDKYNVIVGPNDSGKTNLLRILEKVSKNDDFQYFRINKNRKFDPKKPVGIDFTLELTNQETKLILQCIFAREVTEIEFPESVRTLDVKLCWDDTVMDDPIPSFLSYRFHNGLTIIGTVNGPNIVFDSNIVFQGKTYENGVNSYISKSRQKKLEFATFYQLDHDQDLRESSSFRNAVIKGESLKRFLKKTSIRYAQLPLMIRYDNNAPTAAVIEIMDYLKLEKQDPGEINSKSRQVLASRDITLGFLINGIFRKNFVLVNEIHLGYAQLIQELVKLRNMCAEDYEELQRIFQEITNGIQVRVEQRTPLGEISTNEHILLKDSKKIFSIQDSASGHYALIHMLYLLLNKPDRLIVIDEPEVHFHPIMITRVRDKLRELATEKNNQLIIISHSTEFVTYDLLNPEKESKLTMLLRSNGSSKAHTNSEEFVPKMKRHLFNPKIFFGRCSMIVEGPSDYFALKAISDYHDGLFEKYDITLMHCESKNNIPAFIRLHKKFKIPKVVMADRDYDEDMTDVIKLPKDLEEEYIKTKVRKSSSKLNDDAYPIMEKLLKSKDGLSRLQNTALWPVFEKIINRAGGKIPRKQP